MFPEIILSESIVIPTYIVFLSLLYCFLVFYTFKRAEKLKRPVKTALDLGFIIMVAGFIGGRMLHVLFEAPFYYQEDWLRVFYFWQGGFVFYGGFLTAFAACLLYLFFQSKKNLRHKLSYLQWADFYAPIIALGYGLGRISCFLAGCCYGSACDFPWAVNFPWDLNGLARHPVQLYMTAWELLLFAFLLFTEKKKNPVGQLFFTWLFFHAIGRLIMEYFRDDFRGNLILSMSLSSWISWALILGSIVFLKFRPKPRVKSK